MSKEKRKIHIEIIHDLAKLVKMMPEDLDDFTALNEDERLLYQQKNPKLEGYLQAVKALMKEFGVERSELFTDQCYQLFTLPLPCCNRFEHDKQQTTLRYGSYIDFVFLPSGSELYVGNYQDHIRPSKSLVIPTLEQLSEIYAHKKHIEQIITLMNSWRVMPNSQFDFINVFGDNFFKIADSKGRYCDDIFDMKIGTKVSWNVRSRIFESNQLFVVKP